jgi:tetratricopeptide (TPR) repeat protein
VLFELGGRLRFLKHEAEFMRGQMLLQEAGTLFRAMGDEGTYLYVLTHLGALARDQGDYAQATTILEEALALARDIGGKDQIATASHNLGETALMQGDAARAEALEQVAFTLWREVEHNLSAMPAPALNLAYIALQHGDVVQARVFLTENLATVQTSARWIPFWITAFASLMAAEGQLEVAARLFGAGDVLAEGILPPAHQQEIARHLATVRSQLDEATFAAAWAEGQALTLEQAIAEALNH